MFLSSSQPAMATMVQYIPKDDGRKAVEDMNMPQLGASSARNISDILPPYLLRTALEGERERESSHTDIIHTYIHDTYTCDSYMIIL